MFIQWSDELSVGIQEIDEQHKILVGLVNEMHDALTARQGSEVTGKILERLADYTRIHFAVEESLFRIFDYPGYDEHKKQHDQLIKEVQDLQKRVALGKASVSFELMHFLKQWLAQHIQESDKDYSPFLLKAGMKAKSGKQGWFSRLWQ